MKPIDIDPALIPVLNTVLLAIEGPDGVGKTTMVGAVRKALNHHCYVFDRWWLSCVAMDDFFRRTPTRNVNAELRSLRAAGFRPLVVLLDDKNENIVARLNARGDDDVTAYGVQQMCLAYNRARNEVNLRDREFLKVTLEPDDTILDVACYIASWVMKQVSDA